MSINMNDKISIDDLDDRAKSKSVENTHELIVKSRSEL